MEKWEYQVSCEVDRKFRNEKTFGERCAREREILGKARASGQLPRSFCINISKSIFDDLGSVLRPLAPFLQDFGLV